MQNERRPFPSLGIERGAGCNLQTFERSRGGVKETFSYARREVASPKRPSAAAIISAIKSFYIILVAVQCRATGSFLPLTRVPMQGRHGTRRDCCGASAPTTPTSSSSARRTQCCRRSRPRPGSTLGERERGEGRRANNKYLGDRVVQVPFENELLSGGSTTAACSSRTTPSGSTSTRGC